MSHITLPGRVKVLTSVGLGLTIVIAACGSSSAPSKASYASQANSVCATYNAKLRAVSSDLQSSTSLTQQEQALTTAVSLAQQGTNKLKALKQPSGESAAINRALDAQQQQVTDLQNLLTALKSQNKAQAQTAATTFTNSTASVNQAFDAAGLTTCGSGSS